MVPSVCGCLCRQRSSKSVGGRQDQKKKKEKHGVIKEKLKEGKKVIQLVLAQNFAYLQKRFPRHPFWGFMTPRTPQKKTFFAMYKLCFKTNASLSSHIWGNLKRVLRGTKMRSFLVKLGMKMIKWFFHDKLEHVVQDLKLTRKRLVFIIRYLIWLVPFIDPNNAIPFVAFIFQATVTKICQSLHEILN